MTIIVLVRPSHAWTSHHAAFNLQLSCYSSTLLLVIDVDIASHGHLTRVRDISAWGVPDSNVTSLRYSTLCCFVY